ncbi:hypothetical protein R1flu_001976 [Riccia fluitans]|uniref:Magnesium transporter n=1 Tax=Riccia fluitans TaxID=41844 RepID=A0ABD1Y4T0_9MARC
MSAFHPNPAAVSPVGAGIWSFNGDGDKGSGICGLCGSQQAFTSPSRNPREGVTIAVCLAYISLEGVEEVKGGFEDQGDGSILSAEKSKSREDYEDLASLVSPNGWGSDREVAEADFVERDHRSSGIGTADMGESGTFIRENNTESSDDSWERCSEDNGGGGESSTSSSSITSTGTPSVSAKEPVYEVIEINRQGKAVQKLVSRRQLLRTKGGLRLRDLRRVDPSLWVTNSAPALLVRDQAILLNLGSLRAIATPEDVLIFDSRSIGARGFMDILIPRLEADKTYGHSMPFELEVMESALISRTQRLERALMEVEPRVIALLEVLPTRLTADVLEELRVSKQALVEVGAKAGALRDMLLELLETPQDIRRMTIMGSSCSINREDGDVQCAVPLDKQAAEDEEEEIEMLLEYYLQRCESCHGQAEKLLSSAKEMEESISVNLSSRRLEVSRLELLLQVATFCAALGALVAGIFGMNLKSYLEERAMAFWITTAGIILGGTFLYIYIVSYLKNKKIL